MSIWTSLEPASTTVDAGSTTTVTLRLRNTGDVVEEYRIVPVGDPALWVKVEPPTLKLYPGTSGNVELTFSPPRTPDATAGPNPYGVQIIPSEHPEATIVPEGNLTITPFTDIRAELLPPTCRGRFRGRPTLAVDNVGNVKLTASLAGRETGSQLTFDIRPSSLQIEPGRAAFCKVRIKPNRVMWSGQKENRPFSIAVQRSGAEPQLVDGNYLQQTVCPRWTFRVLSFALMLVVLFVALWFAVHPSVQTKTTAMALTSGSQPVVSPGTGAALPAAPPAPAGGGQQQGGSTSGGGAAAPDPSSDGGGSGTSGGGAQGGSGGGSAGGGGTANSPQTAMASVSLPIKPNNSPPNLFVEFAQYRLTNIGSKNQCRIGNSPGDLSGITLGVLDATTVKQLECFQRTTDNQRYGQLHTAEPGELGRQTMTALWSFDLLQQHSSVLDSGNDNQYVYDANAALNWATQSAITPQLLSNEINEAKAYIATFGANPASAPTLNADSTFENEYQGYMSAVSGVDDSQPVPRGLGAGQVENSSSLGSGSVPASLWVPGTVQP